MTAQRFELPRPDLAPWRAGNTGVEGVWRFESTAAGPEVLVTALVHGNELCGAWALCAALEAGLRPRRGSLVLAFANLAAFDRFDAADHDAARCVDEDLNRVWGDALDRPGARSSERSRALALRAAVERADRLLDLHSMHTAGPPLGLTGSEPAHRALAQAVGTPALLVADGGHAAGRRLRDHGRFADGSALALLVECGFHGDPGSRDVALDVLGRFLVACATNDAADIPAAWTRPLPQQGQQLLRVTDTITVAAGEPPSFAAEWTSGQRLQERGTLIGRNGGRPLFTPYDECVLVMPSLRHAHVGATLVRLAHAEPLR